MGVAEFVARASSDHLATVDTLGESPFDVVGRLAVIGVECQGVCRCAVRLHDGRDPEVVVSVEDGPWQTHAARFSDYVHALAWDILAGSEPTLVAQDVPLREADLDLLRSWFHQGVPTYGWPPGSRNFRFERPGQRVLIWDRDDQADWVLTGITPTELRLPATDVWECGTLRHSLYASGGYYEPSLAEIVLDDLRSGNPVDPLLPLSFRARRIHRVGSSPIRPNRSTLTIRHDRGRWLGR